ncbi:MAG: hypothetical protein IKM04_02660 [Clostridia bacterium]|nr:hypothetical protein [Clostridia bacterium]
MKVRKRLIPMVLIIALLCTSVVIAGDSFSTAVDLTWTTYVDENGNSHKAHLAYALSNMTNLYEFQFFKVDIDEPGAYSIYLSGVQTGGVDAFTSLPCDIDMGVYKSASASDSVGVSWAGSTTPELVRFEVSENDLGTYYISTRSCSQPPENAQFKIVLVRGDVDMFTEGARYRDYNLRSWYCRHNANDTTGYLVTTGTPYSFGNKHSLQFIAEQNELAYVNATQPLNAWSKYAAYTTTAKLRRPGLFMAELQANGDLASQFYGVDCSGFIQRCAETSLTDGVYRYKISRESPLGENGSGSHGAFGSGAYDISTTLANLKTGDIVTKPGHVIMISRASTDDLGYCWAMGAQADGQNTGGRKVQEFIIAEKYGNQITSLDIYALRQ